MFVLEGRLPEGKYGVMPFRFSFKFLMEQVRKVIYRLYRVYAPYLH